MHARLPLLVAAAALVFAACGGDDTAGDDVDEPAVEETTNDDETDSDGDGDDEEVEADDGEVDETAPETAPEVAPETCETTPDPADYDGVTPPPAIRPCELPEDLVVSTIRPGEGPEAAEGDTIIVNYTGIRSEDGEQFDSSYERPVPLDFPLGRGGVIAGWDEGLLGAQAGSLVKLDIPADMAYGDSPPPSDVIRAGDPLTFIVEVEAVVPAVTGADAPTDLDIPVSEGATELEIIDAVDGTGDTAKPGDTAVIQLMLLRGDNQTILHNTWDTNAPIQILMEDEMTIPGLLTGLEGMAVGGQRIIVMPPEEAFGPEGRGDIGLPAGADLVAVVELVGVF